MGALGAIYGPGEGRAGAGPDAEGEFRLSLLPMSLLSLLMARGGSLSGGRDVTAECIGGAG